MAATIKDVAKKAGVSVSTVSLVLNGKSNVSPETRTKVQDVITALEFYPRRNARGFAARKTFNIGFILTEDHFSRAEPFYTKIFLGTEFEARRHSFYVLLTTVPKNFRSGTHLPRFLLEKNVDGVIMAGWVPQMLVEHVQGMSIPAVFVDFCPGRGRHTCVFMDNESGASQAIDHLVSLRHQRIAFLGGDMGHPSMIERLNGYKLGLAENGLQYDSSLVVVDSDGSSVDDGYGAAHRLLAMSPRPTAVFACNDAMAIGCMRYLTEQGVDVPGELSIVGFDDIEQVLMVEPTLTTIQVFKEELGAIALRRIVEMIQEKSQVTGTVLLPVELVVRNSTCKAHV